MKKLFLYEKSKRTDKATIVRIESHIEDKIIRGIDKELSINEGSNKLRIPNTHEPGAIAKMNAKNKIWNFTFTFRKSKIKKKNKVFRARRAKRIILSTRKNRIIAIGISIN